MSLTIAFAGLPEPVHLSRPFGRLVGELLSHAPEPTVTVYAISLLDGDDPARFPTALRYLGGAHAEILLGNRDFALWPVIWGARAMQYVWTPSHAAEATRLVVGQVLDDPEPDVRRAAARALERRSARLDLDLDDLMVGRFDH